MYLCFIDLQKTYESVDRGCLWEVLAKFEIPFKMILVMGQFHVGMRACVRLRLEDGECLEWFAVEQGLRQGKHISLQHLLDRGASSGEPNVSGDPRHWCRLCTNR